MGHPRSGHSYRHKVTSETTDTPVYTAVFETHRAVRPVDLFVSATLSPPVSMNTKALVGVVALLVVVGGIGGVFALGLVPGLGGNSTGSSSTGGGGGGGADGTATYESTVVVEGTGTEGASSTETQSPFSFTIDSIEKCGETCRDVTATITNNQNSTATGVTVRSEIYTGDNYDNKIWEGTSEAGELESGESYTDEKRVELGVSEAYAVQQNDGEILIKTYVVTDDATYVFNEERNVT